jgi:hypothetical protein
MRSSAPRECRRRSCSAFTGLSPLRSRRREVRAWLDKNLHDGGGNTPEEFAAEYRRSFEIYARAIKIAGVKPE